jgi:hypothetical protein
MPFSLPQHVCGCTSPLGSGSSGPWSPGLHLYANMQVCMHKHMHTLKTPLLLHTICSLVVLMKAAESGPWNPGSTCVETRPCRTCARGLFGSYSSQGLGGRYSRVPCADTPPGCCLATAQRMVPHATALPTIQHHAACGLLCGMGCDPHLFCVCAP